MKEILLNDSDRYSIYSFDSVSSSGNLLDRLELEEGKDDDKPFKRITGRIVNNPMNRHNNDSNLDSSHNYSINRSPFTVHTLNQTPAISLSPGLVSRGASLYSGISRGPSVNGVSRGPSVNGVSRGPSVNGVSRGNVNSVTGGVTGRGGNGVMRDGVGDSGEFSATASHGGVGASTNFSDPSGFTGDVGDLGMLRSPANVNSQDKHSASSGGAGAGVGDSVTTGGSFNAISAVGPADSKVRSGDLSAAQLRSIDSPINSSTVRSNDSAPNADFGSSSIESPPSSQLNSSNFSANSTSPALHSSYLQSNISLNFHSGEKSHPNTQNPSLNYFTGMRNTSSNSQSSTSSPTFNDGVTTTNPASFDQPALSASFNSSTLPPFNDSEKFNLPNTSPIPQNRVISGKSPNSPLLKQGESLSHGISLESRTDQTLQLRKIGKHREASYQLQILATPPLNYPKAMYLYAMALKSGQGVQQNHLHYIKWLTKCILLYHHNGLHTMIERLNNLQPEDSVKLILSKIDFESTKENSINDPFELYTKFIVFPKGELSKISNASKFQTDILAVAFFELGNANLNGWGTTKSEMFGIKLLEKSAGSGFIPAMVQLGDIWSHKSKNHRRDLNRAAAWLRLSELFGVKAIGNSWIYKEKYMVPKK